MTMKLHRLFSYVCIASLVSLLLTSCAPDKTVSQPAGLTYEPMKIAVIDCSYGGEIKSVESLDRYTVKFTLCQPDAAFLAKMTSPIFAVQDKDYLDDTLGQTELLSKGPNGTGPYLVKEWSRGNTITLETNPDHWGVPAKARNVVFEWYPTAKQRMSPVAIGVANITENINLADLPAVQRIRPVEVVFRPAYTLMYIGMNRDRKPFDDVNFRRAMASAFDRENLVQTLFPVGSSLAEQVVPLQQRPGFTPGLNWHDFNPKSSGDYLSQSGFGLTQAIRLSFPRVNSPNYPNMVNLADALRIQLEQEGLLVQMNPMPEGEFRQALEAGELSFFIDIIQAEYPDASAFYSTLFATNKKLLGSQNPELTRLLKDATAVLDESSRQEIYDQANRLIREDAMVVPLAFLTSAVVYDTIVENVLVGSFNNNFADISTRNGRLVYVMSGEPLSLWPADEVDPNVFHISNLVYDNLVQVEPGGSEVVADLADFWSANESLTEWTFNLRYGVRYSNDVDLDANDVVASFEAIWNKASLNHNGRTGEFALFTKLFGEFAEITN